MIWAIFALTAGLFFSGKMIISKKLLYEENVSEYLYWYCLFALLVMGFFSFFNWFGLVPAPVVPEIDIILFAIGNGVILCFAWFMFFNAYRHMHVSEIAPLTNLVPVILATIGFLFLGETLNFIQILGILIIVISAYFIEQEETSHGLKLLKIFKNPYFEAMIIYLFISSIVIINEKILVSKTSVISVMIIEYLTVLVLLIGYLIKKKYKDFFKFRGKGIKFVNSFLGVGASLFYLMALSIPGSIVSLVYAIKKFETVIITLFGGKIYKEKHIKEKVVLTLLMLIGMYLVVAG